MVATSSHLEYYGIIHTPAAIDISMVMLHNTLCFIHLLPIPLHADSRAHIFPLLAKRVYHLPAGELSLSESCLLQKLAAIPLLTFLAPAFGHALHFV